MCNDCRQAGCHGQAGLAHIRVDPRMAGHFAIALTVSKFIKGFSAVFDHFILGFLTQPLY